MVYTLLLILAGGMAYVRLAPDDPARWHQPLPPPGEGGSFTLLPPGVSPVRQIPGGATVDLTLFQPDPAGVLARLDAIALATPHTRRLAGSAEAGRITWVTRSAFFGFPDYTTAEARLDGPVVTLRLYARLRYGVGDFGVNAARLQDWLSRLAAD